MLTISKGMIRQISKVYPFKPGYKITGTSMQAAQSMEEASLTLKALVYELLKVQDLTTDECAEKLGKTVLSIRPRLTELEAQGFIHKTHQVRKNASGRNATVWRANDSRS